MPARFQSSHPPRRPRGCIQGSVDAIFRSWPSVDHPFGRVPCPRYGERSDRNLENSNLQSPGNRFLLRQSDMRQFGIGEKSGRYIPITSRAGTIPKNVVAENPKVVQGSVGELGSATHITNRPDAWDICLQAVVNFDKTLAGRFYPGSG